MITSESTPKEWIEKVSKYKKADKIENVLNQRNHDYNIQPSEKTSERIFNQDKPSMKEKKKIIRAIDWSFYCILIGMALMFTVIYLHLSVKFDRIEQKQDKIIEQIQKSHE